MNKELWEKGNANEASLNTIQEFISEVYDYDVHGVEIFENPTPLELHKIPGDKSYPSVRIIADANTKKVYAWDADDAVHFDIQSSLISQGVLKHDAITLNTQLSFNDGVWDYDDNFTDFIVYKGYKTNYNVYNYYKKVLTKTWTWLNKYFAVDSLIDLIQQKVTEFETESQEKEVAVESVKHFFEQEQDEQRLADTNTPAFKKWFGNSKVVDNSGKPLVFYHGGIAGVKVFDPGKAGTIQKSDWGKGIYFTLSKFSADYYRERAAKNTDAEANRLWDEYTEECKKLGTSPMDVSIDLGFGSEKYNYLEQFNQRWRDRLKKIEQEKTGEVYPVYLKIEKPFVHEYCEMTDPFLAETAKDKGCDGIVIVYSANSKNEHWTQRIDEVLVFNPNQIKSIYNNGTFNPNSNNIYEGRIYKQEQLDGLYYDIHRNYRYALADEQQGESVEVSSQYYLALEKQIKELDKLLKDTEYQIVDIVFSDPSLYITLDNERVAEKDAESFDTFDLRLSDHAQPKGGAWSSRDEYRRGESDYSCVWTEDRGFVLPDDFIKRIQESTMSESINTINNFILGEAKYSEDYLKQQYVDTGKLNNDKFEQLKAVDPSKDKKYLFWIITKYLKNTNESETYLEKLSAELRWYEEAVKKNIVKGTQRDINSFKTIKDFVEYTDKFEKPVSNAVIDFGSLNKGTDYDIVFDSDKCMVVALGTYEGAQQLCPDSYCIQHDAGHWNSYAEDKSVYLIFDLVSWSSNTEKITGVVVYYDGSIIERKNGINRNVDNVYVDAKIEKLGIDASIFKYIKGFAEESDRAESEEEDLNWQWEDALHDVEHYGDVNSALDVLVRGLDGGFFDDYDWGFEQILQALGNCSRSYANLPQATKDWMFENDDINEFIVDHIGDSGRGGQGSTARELYSYMEESLREHNTNDYDLGIAALEEEFIDPDVYDWNFDSLLSENDSDTNKFMNDFIEYWFDKNIAWKEEDFHEDYVESMMKNPIALSKIIEKTSPDELNDRWPKVIPSLITLINNYSIQSSTDYTHMLLDSIAELFTEWKDDDGNIISADDYTLEQILEILPAVFKFQTGRKRILTALCATHPKVIEALLSRKDLIALLSTEELEYVKDSFKKDYPEEYKEFSKEMDVPGQRSLFNDSVNIVRSFLLNEARYSEDALRKQFVDTGKISQGNFQELKDMDPTSDKKYLFWIIRLYLKNSNPEPYDTLQGNLKWFEGAVKKNIVKGIQRDINSFKTIEDFNAFVDKFEKPVTDVAIDFGDLTKDEDYKIVFKNDKCMVILLGTYEASQLLTPDSYCIQHEGHYWNEYANNSSVYLVYDFTKWSSKTKKITGVVIDKSGAWVELKNGINKPVDEYYVQEKLERLEVNESEVFKYVEAFAQETEDTLDIQFQEAMDRAEAGDLSIASVQYFVDHGYNYREAIAEMLLAFSNYNLKEYGYPSDAEEFLKQYYQQVVDKLIDWIDVVSTDRHQLSRGVLDRLLFTVLAVYTKLKFFDNELITNMIEHGYEVDEPSDYSEYVHEAMKADMKTTEYVVESLFDKRSGYYSPYVEDDFDERYVQEIIKSPEAMHMIMKRFKFDKAKIVEEWPSIAKHYKVEAVESIQRFFLDNPIADIDTSEFKKWFGKSKVVDSNGKPLICYHQTSKESSVSIQQQGVFKTDKGKARLSDEHIPNGIFFKPSHKDIGLGRDATQIPCYLSLQNPIVAKDRADLVWKYIETTAQGLGRQYNEVLIKLKETDLHYSKETEVQTKIWDAAMRRHKETQAEQDEDISSKEYNKVQNMITQWKKEIRDLAAQARDIIDKIMLANHYDGVIIEKDEGSFGRSTKTFIVLKSNQIKSIYNKGEFNPNSDNIYEAVESIKRFFEDNDIDYDAHEAVWDAKTGDFGNVKFPKITRDGELVGYKLGRSNIFVVPDTEKETTVESITKFFLDESIQIVQEFLEQNLTEKIHSKVYLKTIAQQLVAVLDTNKLPLRKNNKEEQERTKRQYHTRFFATPHAGTVQKLLGNVVIVIDGDKLNQKYAGAWETLNDTLYANTPSIDNFISYIEEVHLLNTGDSKEQMQSIISTMIKHDLPVYVYTDKTQFKNLNKSKAQTGDAIDVTVTKPKKLSSSEEDLALFNMMIFSDITFKDDFNALNKTVQNWVIKTNNGKNGVLLRSLSSGILKAVEASSSDRDFNVLQKTVVSILQRQVKTVSEKQLEIFIFNRIKKLLSTR